MTPADREKLARAARAHFHVTRFRPGQQSLIEAVWDGRDVLGVMPTGGGKSLAYQLPVMFLPKATLVVSPWCLSYLTAAPAA